MSADFQKMYQELQLALCPESNFLDTRLYEEVQEKALKKVKWLHEQAQECRDFKKSTVGGPMLCSCCHKPLYDSQNRCMACRGRRG
jgi:hypothetical protein